MFDLNELIAKSVISLKNENQIFNKSSTVVCDNILFCDTKLLNVTFLYSNFNIIKSIAINYNYKLVQDTITVSIEEINKYIKIYEDHLIINENILNDDIDQMLNKKRKFNIRQLI